MGGACSAYGGRRVTYRVLVERDLRERDNLEDKCNWEDNIKMDFQDL